MWKSGSSLGSPKTNWLPILTQGARTTSRNVSTISAIRRGIGKTQDGSRPGRRPTAVLNPRTSNGEGHAHPRGQLRSERPPSRGARSDSGAFNSSRYPNSRHDSLPRLSYRSRPGENSRPAPKVFNGSSDLQIRDGRRGVPKPISIDYSSPASEFLFGRAAVEAALKAQRRKLHKLYHLDEQGNTVVKAVASDSLLKLAYARGVDVKPLRGEDSTRLLDKMSKGRPHNGVVLEASPLAKLPITTLLPSDPAAGRFNVALDHQSQEETEVNGSSSVIDYSSAGKRHPFLLFLDGVIDPGNLGAILRSAFFLGADAVVLSSHCAPLSPVVLKASAGAAEVMPLLSIHKTGSFIASSRNQGWKFYAAAPAAALLKSPHKRLVTLESLGSPLLENPCVLMLGGEGSGLWQDLISKSDSLLTIQGRRAGEAGIDSLNVSVAAALGCEAFLKRTQDSANQLWN